MPFVCGYDECAVRSVPAAELEETVVAQLRHLLPPLWDELFPAEQARIVRLLVERIDLSSDGMQMQMRAKGLQMLIEELQSREAKAA